MDYNVVSGDAPEGASELEIASAWLRLGAALLDTIFGMLVFFAAGLLGFLVVGFDEERIVIAVVLAIMASVAYVVVHYAMVAASGQSPGKKAVGIKIIRVDGRELGFGGMLVREIVGKAIPSMVPILNIVWLLSYVWILVDAQRQGWHDKIAGTYVVKV